MELIKQAREKAGVTQKDLAKVLQVNAQFISNIERGVCQMPVRHFRLISKTLNLPITLLAKAAVKRYTELLELKLKEMK
jgi:transcriptional regulator with XRE-family HTH domain